jgi:NADPH:quinone reductase-like Zn-dependent oxidoreductase
MSIKISREIRGFLRFTLCRHGGETAIQRIAVETLAAHAVTVHRVSRSRRNGSFPAAIAAPAATKATIFRMKSLVFEQFGEPEAVLHMVERPSSEPGRGMVRVRMIASPINPSDLMVVRGRYGRLPQLPATPGFEGVGIVEAAGPGLLGRLRNGKRVAVLNGEGGNWQQYVIVPARNVVPVPAQMPDEQAATFFVNPATALIITRHVLRVPPAGWLLQSAAASNVGKMIIRLGKRFGFRTINIVRRADHIEPLRQLGADFVIVHPAESIGERVMQITGGQGAGHAIDAVGGSTAAAMIAGLSQGGRLVSYGTLSGDPAPLDPRELMVKGAAIEGFWLSNWTRRQGPLKMLRLFHELSRLIVQGELASEIAASYPVDKFPEAIQKVQGANPGGKVLLRFD